MFWATVCSVQRYDLCKGLFCANVHLGNHMFCAKVCSVQSYLLCNGMFCATVLSGHRYVSGNICSGQWYSLCNGRFCAMVPSGQWYIWGNGTLRYHSGLVRIRKLRVRIDISLTSNPRLDIECAELIASHNSVIQYLLLGILRGPTQLIRLTMLTSIKKDHMSSRSCTPTKSCSTCTEYTLITPPRYSLLFL